ncbi:MAG: hypothetical protein AXW15_07820 [Neptuniibacter sp. Phe_28]|nr:MAG: hypothetical protein AXW15_07820 [Neptuniibacter sp. Phe_28]
MNKTNSFLTTNLLFLMAKNSIPSATELARLSGLKQPTVHRIIKGESRDPRLSNLKALADVFGIKYWKLTEVDFSTTIDGIEEGAGHYFPNKDHRLSLDDKKLLYCAIIAAKETLENGKAISGDDYGFKELAKVTVLKFDEFVEGELSADDLIASLNDSVEDVNSAMSV